MYSSSENVELSPQNKKTRSSKMMRSLLYWNTDFDNFENLLKHVDDIPGENNSVYYIGAVGIFLSNSIKNEHLFFSYITTGLPKAS